ncbi:MAG: tetratricopeptide repeat-containing sensor histidine kinase [Ignavibacteriae bacterium]|nr:tetratricopeptide repeat-containing sensor histidine kinase [Ignavibacteriota bacterium]
MILFKQIFLVTSLIICATFSIYSQQQIADSLLSKLNYVNGKEKVKILNELSDIYQNINTQQAIVFAEKGISEAKEISDDIGLAGCYGSLGYAYINLNNNKAAEYTNKALEIRRKINDKAGIATSLNVLGVLYYYEADYLKSIEYHLEALKRREEIGDPVKTATSYNNIALVNIALENYEAALDYLNKALKVRTATNNKRSIGIIKANIGKIQIVQNKTEEALETFFESLEINKELGNYKSVANSHQNIASVYKKLSKYPIAISYYDSALAIYYFQNEKNGLANVENGLAEVYKLIQQFDNAINHANIALKHAEEINSLENKLLALQTLFESYEQKNDFKNAYKYLNNYRTAYLDLKNNEKIKKLANVELNYKLEKLKKEQEQKLLNQSIYIFILLLTVIFGAIILFLLSKSSKNKKKANEELNKLNSKLIEVNKTKDKFLSIIAHDMRGPYQSTLGLSQLLADEFESLEQDELKNNIIILNSSLKNQYNLLNDLLHWAELQAGNFELDTENIELSKRVDGIISLLNLSAQKKNIKLVNNVNPTILVSADENMLKLVLRNLISNSIKFTHENGIVEITAVENQGKAEICISDNGVGISENDSKNLFKLDVHYTKNGTANEKGSGLGLILCKEIIEKNNGSIWVESEVNKGSKFYFSFPLANKLS